MAKNQNQPHTDETETGQAEAAAVMPPAPAEEQAPAAEKTPEKTPKKEPAQKAPAEIPAAVLAILGKFPGYKELYIDADGSMYTPQTSPAIRGKAVLYRNPYYKS